MDVIAVPDLSTSELKSGRSQIWEGLCWDHRTIRLMKLMVSIILSSAIKRQYSSVFVLLRYFLPVFDEICGSAMTFVFFLSGNINYKKF